MKISAKGIFIGLAGLAAVSGAGYYLYKKKYLTQQDGNNQIFSYLRQIIFQKQQIPFERILNTFNQAQNQSIGKLIFELSKNNPDQEPIQSKVCRKNLLNSYFYECLDCSAQFKNKKNEPSDKENMNLYSHQICEDCFDREIHRGHKYKLILCEVEGKCDCGYSFLVDEKSFCSKHCGYSSIKSEFSQSISQETKNQILEYYKELFYILIDGQSDKLYNTMKKQNTNLQGILSEPNLFDKFNSFFQMILESIQQTCDSYHPLIYCFSELMKSTFTKPTRIDQSIDQINFNHSKNIDNTETIFAYLLKYQVYLNEKNTQAFSDFLEVLCAADKDFVTFVFYQYIRLIIFTFKFEVAEDGYEQYQYVSVTKLSEFCLNGCFSREVIENYCLQNEGQVIKQQQFFNFILNNIQFANQSEYKLVYAIFNIIQGIFEQPQLLNQFQRIEELIELLVDFTYIFFEKIQLVDSQQLNIYQDLLNKIHRIFGFTGFSSYLIDLWYKIAAFSHKKQLSQETNDKILKILSKKFKETINTHHTNMNNNQGQLQNYFGFSYCSLIICIVIMSEGINLSETDVRNAFKKNFDFENESEMNEFINKTVDNLHHNLISFCFHDNGYLLIPFTMNLLQNPDDSDLIQSQWDFIQKCEFTVYDSHILAYQLLTSVQDKSNNFVSYMLTNFSIEEISNAGESHTYLTKPLHVLRQIYFDQTPFINLNKKLNNILTQDNQLFQDKIEYTTKQVINNVLKWQPNKSQSYKEFVELVNFIILDKELIKKILPQFGDINESTGQIDLKPLDDELEITSLNLGRYSSNVIDPLIQNETSFFYIYTYVPGVFPHLFDYQQKLVIKSFANFNLFIQFREKLNQPSNIISQLLFFFNSIVVIWFDLIELFDTNSSLLNENEKSSIQLLKQEMYSQESIQIIKPIVTAINKEDMQRLLGLQQIQKAYSSVDLNNSSQQQEQQEQQSQQKEEQEQDQSQQEQQQS